MANERVRRAALLIIFLLACASPKEEGDAGIHSTDASEATPDASTDAGVTCACDPDEQCAGCFANIGVCCYGDPTLGGQASRLTAACEAQPACKACCRECEEASCETLRETHSCPAETR